MTALPTRRNGWPAAAGLEGVVALVAAALGGTAAAAAAACGIVLLVRRLAVPGGDFVGGRAALAVAAAGAALVLLADAATRLGGGRFASLAARAGLVLGVAAVTLPPRAPSWLDGAATALAVAIAGGAVALAPQRTAARETARRPGPRPTAPRRRPRGSEERVPGRLRQRLVRYAGRAGGDCLRGRVLVEIAAGARTAQGHVGFCPAFATTPAVEVTTDYDGVEATVAAAEVLPWGVRVEVRLAEPAEEPLEIPVDLLARAPL